MTKQELFFSDIEAMDKSDPIARKRNAFSLPENTIYLDGNSLGPTPIAAIERAQEVVNNQWRNDLITSWNQHQWIELPTIVGEKIAPLIGADTGQVICCDSVSINLFKLMAAGLSLNPGRKVILSQRDNFPTDLYMAQGLESLIGSDKCQLKQVDGDQILEYLDETVAVLMLTQVNFRTGEVHDMAAITQAAHDKGILVIWDLAHSAGVMPIELDSWQVDFAVGCGYKYFNGGPGAPAFVYVAERHQDNLSQPLSGWMGHSKPFDFSPDYQPAQDIKAFLCGTPQVISMSVLDAALDVYNDISIEQIRAKSLAMSDLFMRLVKQYPALRQLDLITPTQHAIRGSQVAYRHEHAYAICQALIAEDIIADFRAPDILRIGFSPLFLTFENIYQSVESLNNIVEHKIYDQPKFHKRQAVT
ncbi:MAG: kynureninase [Kangiellaceae bacterium]|nr:kynureninase [Kangiellaceae bacterium]